MQRLFYPGLAFVIMSFALPVMADENKQCETISALTGDYFHHKKSGKSKMEVQQTLRPDFMNNEFLRSVDLAINLAYTFSDDMTEELVEKKVYEGCEAHQR